SKLMFSSNPSSDPTGVNEMQLNQTFAALANTTRRAILARLVEGDATVNELAEPFEMSLPAISKHIKVLERAGLIQQGQHAQYRPCSLNASPIQHVATWTETYRPIWEARFDKMSAYVKKLEQPSENESQNKKDAPIKGESS
ncbi:MAG: metalloregulator ArsR/SmtB family transcription factor, partial [Deinococcota bacterium]